MINDASLQSIIIPSERIVHGEIFEFCSGAWQPLSSYKISWSFSTMDRVLNNTPFFFPKKEL